MSEKGTGIAMDLIVCFIDDSKFEHDLVREEIAPSAPRLTFLQAYTFEEAMERLGRRIPILFLLDLWGQDPTVKDPSITPKHDLEERIAEFKSVDSVYEGLEGFQGDQNNEYLKRLFAIVDSWRNLFEDTCGRAGQNRKYGLGNLHQARENFPAVPSVFYTRKSLISDAVAIFQAGADGLFIKPTRPDDSMTRLATREYAPQLIQDLSLVVDRHLGGLEEKEGFYVARGRIEEGEVKALAKVWRRLRNPEKTSAGLP